MEHGGGAHTGANIGRAGGKVAEGGREGEFEFVFEGCIELVGGFPSFEKMEARAEGLKADMIFLVDHDREGFVAVHDEAAPSVLGSVFAADEVFFDEKLFVERGERFHCDGNLGGAHGGKIGHGRLDRFQEFQAIGFFEPTGEREVLHIAGQTDPTGDDDARFVFRGRGGGRMAVFRFHIEKDYP